MARYSYKKALEKLRQYAESEGFIDISFEDDYSFISWDRNNLYNPSILHIQAKETIENQVYLMLHELGHHELRKNWDNFEKRFPVIAYAEEIKLIKNNKKYMRRNSYIVSSLEEEFMAWSEGLKLSISMDIKVNMKKWIEIKSRCLKRYINYYANLSK
jgi:hypothetical protein